MGTRSLTHIQNEDGKTIATIYRQYDGYPGGMGADILKVAKSGKLVNGYQGDGAGQFNGIGCFAAQLICDLKKENPNRAGNVYIFEPNAKDSGEEYVYRIRPVSGEIVVEVDQMDGKGFENLEAVLSTPTPA